MLCTMAHGEVLAGMAAAALAAVCFDGAVLLQAGEARTIGPEHALRLSLLRRLVARPRWVLGSAIAVLGWPLQLLALSLAPVTLVQPTLALGLVVLLLGATRVLGERVGRREWASAGAVIVGVAVLAVAAPSHTDALPGTTALIVVGAVLGVPVALPLVAGGKRAGSWTLIAGGGSAFALAAIGSKLLTVEIAAGRPLAAAAWAVVTAAFAGAGFIIDMSAMQRFEASRVAPPMFVLETALPVILAPLLFGERWGATPAGGAVMLAGVLLVLLGGAGLGASRATAHTEPQHHAAA
jgi:drug/metabolite transporter (DMT)-like permease